MTNQSEGSAAEKAKAEMLTVEELAELERLRTEVDRLTGQFEDGGCKNMGVAQQLSYAQDRLGQAMMDKRAALLAMASRLVEVESMFEYLNEVHVSRYRTVEQFSEWAKSCGWTSPTQKPNDGSER